MAHLQESFPAPWVAAALALPAGSALFTDFSIDH